MASRRGFIGREVHVDEVVGLIPEQRLVTIVGAGGVGKTRLAREVIAADGLDLPEGARFVELSQLTDAAQVPDAVASALGYSSFDAAVAALAASAPLIVIDNCEHVLDGVRDLVRTLLDDAPDLRLVATSRVGLDLDGEHVYPLPPLASADAAELLRVRAAASGARLRDDEPTNAALAALADRVDGLPLALELAAIRLRSMSPGDVVAALDTGADVLRQTDRPDGRHTSLDTAIEWSHALLDHDLAAAFRQLAVIEGPIRLDIAHEVIGGTGTSKFDTADLLDRLVVHSLLRPATGGTHTMWRFLDTIRRFARDRLVDAGELEAARDRYVDGTLAIAESIVQRGMHTWSQELVEEAFALVPDTLATVRLCLATDSDPSRALPLLVPAWGVIHSGHAGEIAELGATVLERWQDPRELWWPDVAAITATAFFRIADFDRATAFAEAALANGGLVAAPIAHRVLALIHQHAGRFGDAIDHADHAINAAEGLRLEPFVTEFLILKATLTAQLGDIDDALQLVRAARVRMADSSDLVGQWSAVLQSYLETATGAAPAAPIDEATYEHNWLAQRHVAIMALRRGDHSAAAGDLRDALDATLAAGEIPHTWATLHWIAIAALVAGQDELIAEASSLLATVFASPLTPALGAVEQALASQATEAAVAGDPFPSADAPWAAFRLLDRLQQRAVAADPTSEPMAPSLRAGDVWKLSWRNAHAELKHSKGLADIAALIAAAGNEVHALELMGATVDQSGVDSGLDATAKRQYEQRLRELQDELDEADATNDVARSERAQAEFDQILDALSAAVGLGGRDRSAGSSAERARSAVTWRIRSAIKKIDEHLPGMAQHLRLAIKTGTWCSYQPEQDVAWHLE